MTKKQYNFGEKTEEYHVGLGEKLPVWQSPKYLQSKEKAIELIESGSYGLDTGDFWILQNATKSKKMMYTGLIISHNGCLKINDKLPIELKFKPSSVSFVKDDGDKTKVMSYINEEQGVYEFGEISPNNCKNDYPYAMVLKRLMDRVILKNSKVGFFGIYSEAESEDFKDKHDSAGGDGGNKAAEKPKGNALQRLAAGADEEMKTTFAKENEEMAKRLIAKIEGFGSVSELEGWLEDKAVKSAYNRLAKYDTDSMAEVTKAENKFRFDNAE